MQNKKFLKLQGLVKKVYRLQSEMKIDLHRSIIEQAHAADNNKIIIE